MIIQTSGGDGGPIHYQTVVHSGGLSSVVAATGLVTSSGIVNANGLVSNSNLVNTANIVTNSSLAEQLNSVVQTGEKLNSLVHPGGGGDLDREKLHTLIHTGDLDTVQLVHSYNLPPSAEKEQHTVVEQLLLQASALQQVGRLFVRKKINNDS